MTVSINAVDVDHFKHAELVFALVSPVGTDYVRVAQHLSSQLTEFGYQTNVIGLSGKIATLCNLLKVEDVELAEAPEFQRIRSHMKAANAMYRKFNEIADDSDKNALLALAAATDIAEKRRSKDPNITEKRALLNKCHVLATLKRPEEINYLRRIYGIGLHVIGVFATEEERIAYLIRKKQLTEVEAKSLILDDQNDKESGGQRTVDAFHLSDVFIDGGNASDDWKREIGRYLDLLFSHPYKTPSRDEEAMFMAYASSLRSAQFGRQVGAAVASPSGDLLAVGCNEVPKAGGGQYWDKDAGDDRDHQRGKDSNDSEKNKILDEIMSLLPEVERTPSLRENLRKTSLFSITEFGRATHAEMEAILSCARKGISPVGMTLYTTTYPCHNCARHIIDAGIERVVYIEPYPKSRTTDLHDDAVTQVDASRNVAGIKKVLFVPFVGISPRKYAEIFTVKPMYGREVDRKLRASGNAISWERSRTGLRLQMIPLSYIGREELAIAGLAKTFEQHAAGQQVEEQSVWKATSDDEGSRTVRKS